MSRLSSEDSAYVYIMLSTCGSLFKIGKANDVSVRLGRVGADKIDLTQSYMLRVASEEQAYRLERCLHLAFFNQRVSKERAAGVIGSNYDGLTEWFESTCLTRVDEYIRHHEDLFPHDRIHGESLITHLNVAKVGRQKNGRRVRLKYTDEDLWNAGRPQVDMIVLKVRAVIQQARTPVLRDFSIGHAELQGVCSPAETVSMTALLQQALQGGISIDNYGINLVTSCTHPSAATDYAFRLGLSFPGMWDASPLSTRLKAYFVEQLSGLCPVEVLSREEGWNKLFS